MPSVIILGAQWGDEGKGKIVDHYAGISDVVVRYQGGSNAGHTLVIDGKKIVMHLVPAGIVRQRPVCVLADNVVIEPNILLSEIDAIRKGGYDVSPKRFKISARAHVTMPYHISIDHLRELKRARAKIGTTGRGVGPTYEDKAARRGIRIGDLVRPNILRERLEVILDDRNYYIKNYLEEKPFDFNELYESSLKIGEVLAPHITDTSKLIWEANKANKKVLFEGAQGVMLDLDGGTYPYVTSSNTTAGSAVMSGGISPMSVKNVVGVVKAYTTRVGEGPLPTELLDETGELLRFHGGEYGATTGRPRRCGWLDIVCLRYAIRYGGISSFILTKLDVLSKFPEIKVAVAYEIEGKRYDDFPYDISMLSGIKLIYETFPGWNKDLKGVETINELPKNAQNYVNWINEQLDIPLVMLSLGAGRGEGIESYNPFED